VSGGWVSRARGSRRPHKRVGDILIEAEARATLKLIMIFGYFGVSDWPIEGKFWWAHQDSNLGPAD
jgi:hypothetical protein